MLKTFQQFIKESEDLFVPRNLDGREDMFFRNLQRKLNLCNGVWNEDLNMEKMQFPLWFKIPDNLKVSGWLNLCDTNISKLPDNLKCRSLYLETCKNIKELPESLNIQFTINLSNSSIEKLPKNLQCKSLYLNDCKNIKELPEGLSVESTISLKNSSIERLPKNLQCKDLWIENCKNIKELPEGLQLDYLFIENSSLTEEYCVHMKQEGKISYLKIINI